MIDLRTEREKAYDEKCATICSEYAEMKSEYPAASNNRLFGALATKHSMTAAGVRLLLLRRGAI